MYEDGQGITKDYKEAVKWYRLSANQGYALAQYNLGSMYYNGQGVKKNNAEAARWYRLAAVQGYASAQYNLGVMYENGQGVIKDYVRAHMWFDISASSGNKDALSARDVVASKMYIKQIRKAQEMALLCWRSNFTICD